MTNHRLHGHAAIAYAEKWDLPLNKYQDPTEGARLGITVAEARDIAAEDPGLIYLELPTQTKHRAAVRALKSTAAKRRRNR